MNSAKEHFAQLLEGATAQSLDPMSCLPFTRIRNIVDGCVEVLCNIFEELGGLTTGGSMAYAIRLEGVYASYPLEYFRDKMGSEEDANKEVSKRELWYGIVDGEHRLTALQKLICKDPAKWAGFSWTVTILKTSASLAALRAFARACNQKNVDDFVVIPTQYDVLKNLKQDYTTLSAKLNRKAKPIELAIYYSGSKEACTSTIKQLAGCVIRLPQSVIDTIGKIVNEENKELAMRIHYKTNSKHSKNAAVDSRIYRNLISSSTLKGSTPFMNAEGPDGEAAQLNSLWRIREISRSSGYGPMKPSVLTEQFLAASAALQEVRKFEKLMETVLWPKEMEVMRRNAERTQLFDEEIAANFGNLLEPLPAFYKAFKLSCPAVAHQKLLKFRGDMDCSPTGQNKDAETRKGSPLKDVYSEENEPSPSNTGNHSVHVHLPTECGVDDSTLEASEANYGALGSRKVLAHSDKRSNCSSIPEASCNDCSNLTSGDREHRSPQLVSALAEEIADVESVLENAGMKCFAMEWQHFEKHNGTYESLKGRVSTILTDPPYSLQNVSASGAGSTYDDFLDDKEITAFTQFSRRLLCPEGSVVMFTSWQTFPRWFASFSSNGFQVLNYPIVVAKDTKTIRRNGRLKMPQCAVDFILLAYAPGKVRDVSRAIDFDCPYQLINCSHSRKFNIIDGVPVPRAKLQHIHSRKIVRVEEKNIDLLQELLTSFCPSGGIVCDPYAGTLTTGLACLQTSREAILIEKDQLCLSLGKERLAKVAADLMKKKATSNLTLRSEGRVREASTENVHQSPDQVCREPNKVLPSCGRSQGCGENVEKEVEGLASRGTPLSSEAVLSTDIGPNELQKRSLEPQGPKLNSVRKSKRLKKNSAETSSGTASKKRLGEEANCPIETSPRSPTDGQTTTRTNCILSDRCNVLALMPDGHLAMTSHRCDMCGKYIHSPCEYGKRVLGIANRCEKWACSKECFEHSMQLE